MENRHPVDELAEIRAERRRLTERETSLRARLTVPGADLEGEHYRGTVNVFERPELDRDKLEMHFGSTAIAACETLVRYQVITLAKHPPGKAPAATDVFDEVA